MARYSKARVLAVGIEGTDEITTIRRTTLRLFRMVVTSSVPSMSVPSMSNAR
jgi:hypothetical protein